MTESASPVDERISFRDHLIELRKRLLLSAIAIVIFAAIGFYFAEDLYRFLRAPMVAALPEGSSFIVTGPIEYFVVLLKVSLAAGLLGASPWVLFQAWKFIAPALYANERRYAAAFVFFGSTFFISGAAFAYFVVFPAGLPFLVGLNPPDIHGMYKVSEYFSFAIRLLMAFGIAFELPVVIVLLCLLGVVTPDFFSRFRKYAIVLSFVFAALLTPPDVITQVSMAVPLYFLYEAGLLVARILTKKNVQEAQTDDDLPNQDDHSQSETARPDAAE